MSEKTNPTSKESYAMTPARPQQSRLVSSQNTLNVAGQLFPIRNSFTPLVEQSQTFAQKFTLPKSPALPSSSQTKFLNQQKSFKSPYFIKPETKIILIIDPKIYDTEPYQILRKTTYPHYFVTNDPNKGQRFYEFILVDTNSITITHNQDKESGQISHSKIKFVKS